MTKVYITLGLIVLVILAPLAVRLFTLRPWAVRTWRRNPQPPLNQPELTLLKHWQVRNLALVLVFGLVGLVDAVGLGLQLLEGPARAILWGGFVFSGLLALGHHYTARCPRCGMVIGLQSNLLLPQRCARCRVGLRTSPPDKRS